LRMRGIELEDPRVLDILSSSVMMDDLCMYRYTLHAYVQDIYIYTVYTSVCVGV
jgi:hypothetical protein